MDNDLQQGDIFSTVPFVEVDSDGHPRLFMLRGMLLTNSCDCTRNDNLQFAAIWPLNDYSLDENEQKAIKSNINYQYLYYPDTKLDDSFVDFGLITSISRIAFEKFVSAGKSERVATLSDIGYFLFVTKLTVFFMRPEDADVLASREISVSAKSPA